MRLLVCASTFAIPSSWRMMGCAGYDHEPHMIMCGALPVTLT